MIADPLHLDQVCLLLLYRIMIIAHEPLVCTRIETRGAEPIQLP